MDCVRVDRTALRLVDSIRLRKTERRPIGPTNEEEQQYFDNWQNDMELLRVMPILEEYSVAEANEYCHTLHIFNEVIAGDNGNFKTLRKIFHERRAIDKIIELFFMTITNEILSECLVIMYGYAYEFEDCQPFLRVEFLEKLKTLTTSSDRATRKNCVLVMSELMRSPEFFAFQEIGEWMTLVSDFRDDNDVLASVSLAFPIICSRPSDESVSTRLLEELTNALLKLKDDDDLNKIMDEIVKGLRILLTDTNPRYIMQLREDGLLSDEALKIIAYWMNDADLGLAVFDVFERLVVTGCNVDIVMSPYNHETMLMILKASAGCHVLKVRLLDFLAVYIERCEIPVDIIRCALCICNDGSFAERGSAINLICKDILHSDRKDLDELGKIVYPLIIDLILSRDESFLPVLLGTTRDLMYRDVSFVNFVLADDALRNDIHEIMHDPDIRRLMADYEQVEILDVINKFMLDAMAATI